jgi:hypothetical protein
MPQPTQNEVHIDAVLTNVSVAFMQDAANFIAGQVFPVVPVDKQSDKYFVYDQNDWFRDEAQVRADGDESVGSGYSLSTDNYYCDVWALHKDVGDQTRANADSAINVDREAAEFVTQRLLLRREAQFVTDYLTTGVWGWDIAGVSGSPSTNEVKKWSASAAAPIDDVEEGKATVLEATGLEPNTLVLGYNVFRALKRHPSITELIKYTSSQTITADMLARIFEVDRVLVSKSVKASNKEGATAAYGFTTGDVALLAHVAPNPGLLVPSAGYTFAWNGVSGGLGTTIGTSSFRMPERKATRVEGEIAFDNKVVAKELGYMWNAIV